MDLREYIVSKFSKSPNSKGKIHARCPFHDDKHASFSIDTNSGLFICGSPRCGVRGGFVLFYKLMEGITSWREVYDKLHKPSIAVDLKSLFDSKQEIKNKTVINNFPTPPFIKDFQVEGIEYLRSRNIPQEVCDLFGVKYGREGDFDAVDIRNTLVVPIFDLNGVYRTFQVRRLYKSALRWVTPAGSPLKELLYAAWLVQGQAKHIWIVEGVSDAWNLWAHNIAAVALFSKEASAAQYNKIDLICKTFELTPVVCMDGDAKLATDKIYQELKAYGLHPLKVYLQPEEDPGSLNAERVQEILGGLDAGKSITQFGA